MDLIGAFEDINNSDRLLQDLRDAIVHDAITQPADSIFTIVPGIKGGQQVVALKDQEYITKQQSGCDDINFSSFNIDGISQKWNPRSMDVRIKMCYKEFEGAFVQWGLANGYDRRNLKEADFFDFIKDMTTKSMAKDFTRVSIFGNKDIATDDILGDNASGAVEDYNQIDAGLLKTLQLFKANPKLADQFVDITKNAAGTLAAQKLEAGEANTIYDALVESLEFDGGDQFLTSNTLFKNYKDQFRANMLESGVAAIQKKFEPSFDDRMLTNLKFMYDRYVKRDFRADNGDGTFVDNIPHLAMIADKSNLQIGVDDTAALTDLRLEYVGGKDENFYIKASYLMDFKIPNPFAVQAAF